LKRRRERKGKEEVIGSEGERGREKKEWGKSWRKVGKCGRN